MKILYIIRSPVYGGVEEVVAQLTNKMNQTQHEAEILFLFSTPCNNDFANVKAVKHYNRGILLLNIFRNISLFTKFDIAHNHSFGFIVMYVWFVALISRTKLITTIHSSFNLNGSEVKSNKSTHKFWIYYILEKCFGLYGKQVIVVAPYIKNIANRFIGINKNKITIINNISIPTDVQMQRLTLRGKNVVFAGRLSEEKQIHLIIKAWGDTLNKINEKDWKLLIYGSGPFLNNLTNLSNQLALNNSVEFKGYTHDIYAALSDCQIGVSASKFEGLPLSIIEYMNAGLCCVASDIEAHRYLEVSNWGLVTDVYNSDLFSDSLAALINNNQLREDLSSAAQIVADKYTPEKFIKSHLSLYKTI